MPTTILPPSRNHRLEVKYNVITGFPHLGLHSASASGDIGLVQYAISHGQPVNSVLDGVLPLHAACAGGNVLVVNFLIENGADVNAPRLPRRYSDRNRDATAPIVGTSGSTPLHFAAANGHLNIVRILLSQGAAPDHADKHGITPEIIARQNGWIECAELLAQAATTVKHSGTSYALENLEALRKRLRCLSISAEPEADAEKPCDSPQRLRKIPAPLDIDISTISSYAQAEQLVQRTQQSILNMEEHLDQHVKKDSETGRTPLSAKLAAYGESLAIERRLKEHAQASPEHGSLVNGSVSLLSATKPSVIYPELNSWISASSTESTSQEMQSEHTRQATWPTSYDEPRGFPSSPPGDLMYSQSRSRTPDPEPEFTSPLAGIPLSRVSTAPSYDSTSFRRGRQQDPSRSAQKLTRMGFSTFDNWRTSPLKGRASRSPPPSLRFGLRTIMQSFQGK